jgi:hypothetical protein
MVYPQPDIGCSEWAVITRCPLKVTANEAELNATVLTVGIEPDLFSRIRRVPSTRRRHEHTYYSTPERT